MFDIGASEVLVVVVVAVIVIGPKDMPVALRTAGRWIGKMRRASNHIRTGIDAMVREAEMEDMEREWKERNAQIMAQTPTGEMEPAPAPDAGASEDHPGVPDGAAAPAAEDTPVDRPEAG